MLRRDFLRYLLGGGASIAALAALPPAMAWAAESSDGPLIGGSQSTLPGYRLPLDWLVREVARLMDERLARPFGRAGERIGDAGATEQFSVQMAADFGELSPAVFSRRYLAPMAAQLAAEMQRLEFTRVGELHLPPSVEAASRVTTPSGLSVRGLYAYSVFGGEKIVRFDVLGG